MDLNQKALLELAETLDEAKFHFDQDESIDLCIVLFSIVFKLDEAGMNAFWLKKLLADHFSKKLDQETKNQGIFSLIYLLEQYNCSQLQASQWMAEWAGLSQRRILQIFQKERKAGFVKNLVYLDEVGIEGLAEQIITTKALWFLLSLSTPLPKTNPHALRSLKNCIDDIKSKQLNKNGTEGIMSLNQALLEDLSSKKILPS
jgi:hypothetical protein